MTTLKTGILNNYHLEVGIDDDDDDDGGGGDDGRVHEFVVFPAAAYLRELALSSWQVKLFFSYLMLQLSFSVFF